MVKPNGKKRKNSALRGNRFGKFISNVFLDKYAQSIRHILKLSLNLRFLKLFKHSIVSVTWRPEKKECSLGWLKKRNKMNHFAKTMNGHKSTQDACILCVCVCMCVCVCYGGVFLCECVCVCLSVFVLAFKCRANVGAKKYASPLKRAIFRR